MSTLSPGESVLVIAASQPPVPLAGNVMTGIGDIRWARDENRVLAVWIAHLESRVVLLAISIGVGYCFVNFYGIFFYYFNKLSISLFLLTN